MFYYIIPKLYFNFYYASSSLFKVTTVKIIFLTKEIYTIANTSISIHYIKAKYNLLSVKILFVIKNKFLNRNSINLNTYFVSFMKFLFKVI